MVELFVKFIREIKIFVWSDWQVEEERRREKSSFRLVGFWSRKIKKDSSVESWAIDCRQADLTMGLEEESVSNEKISSNIF